LTAGPTRPLPIADRVTVPKTDKRYLDDPYTMSFRARVHSSAPAEGGIDVILEQSYFYPESGGQLADAGTIAGLRVVDVQERGEDAVVHRVALEGSVAAPDGEVDCAIEWERRFDHMQQHTGQHVLSRAFIETGGRETVSFHMGEDACTIDLDGAALDEDGARAAEALANRVIEENRAVRVRTVAVSELAEESLRRKLPEGVREVRLVEVADFDTCGCCGTHVRATGELQLVKVLKWEKAKGTTRVTFKAGRRALADYNEKHDLAQELANRFTTAISEVAGKVDRLVAEGQTGRKALARASERLAGFERDALLASARVCGGVRVVARVLEEGDGAYARALSSAIQAAGGAVAVLGARDGTVLCAASKGVAVDFTDAIAWARGDGGSGGGKGPFAQIRLAPGGDVAAFVTRVGGYVEEQL